MGQADTVAAGVIGGSILFMIFIAAMGFAIWIAFGYWAARICRRNGRSVALGWLLGLWLSWIGVIICYAMGPAGAAAAATPPPDANGPSGPPPEPPHAPAPVPPEAAAEEPAPAVSAVAEAPSAPPAVEAASPPAAPAQPGPASDDWLRGGTEPPPAAAAPTDDDWLRPARTVATSAATPTITTAASAPAPAPATPDWLAQAAGRSTDRGAASAADTPHAPGAAGGGLPPAARLGLLAGGGVLVLGLAATIALSFFGGASTPQSPKTASPTASGAAGRVQPTITFVRREALFQVAGTRPGQVEYVAAASGPNATPVFVYTFRLGGAGLEDLALVPGDTGVVRATVDAPSWATVARPDRQTLTAAVRQDAATAALPVTITLPDRRTVTASTDHQRVAATPTPTPQPATPPERVVASLFAWYRTNPGAPTATCGAAPNLCGGESRPELSPAFFSQTWYQQANARSGAKSIVLPACRPGTGTPTVYTPTTAVVFGTTAIVPVQSGFPPTAPWTLLVDLAIEGGTWKITAIRCAA